MTSPLAEYVFKRHLLIEFDGGILYGHAALSLE
jgi:hypothetical protein